MNTKDNADTITRILDELRASDLETALQRIYEIKSELKLISEDCSDGTCRACCRCYDAKEAEVKKLRAQSLADLRAIHDALGWAHENHGSKLPEPWRGITELIAQRNSALLALDELKMQNKKLNEAMKESAK